jgi:FHA domain
VFVPKPPKKLKGRPTFDARGNAVWRFSEKSGAKVETENVKALADGMSLEGPSQEVSLDPYNQALAQSKARGRSLDDMRRLNEQMQREHEELVRKLRNEPLKPRTRTATAVRARRLRLKIGHRELLVDEHNASVSIGRSDDNDVVINGEQVSRQHVRIEFSGNKLVLIDRSANGTFVQTESGEMSRIRHDSVQLDGQGVIGVGRRPQQNAPHTIHFICEQV